MHNNKKSLRTAVGIILIILGGLFILENYFEIPYYIDEYLFSWESLLIVIGLVFLFSSNNKSAGVVLICVGVSFILVDQYDYSVFYLLSEYWPILLIIAGISILFDHKKKPKEEAFNNITNENFIDISSFFTSTNKSYKGNNFEGAKLTSIFGSSNLDLVEADMEKEKVVVDVLSIFGGGTVKVPKNCKTIVNVTTLFGGIDDKRSIFEENQINSSKTLIIKGFACFGGVEII